MFKPQFPEISETNIALFGTEIEYKIKQTAAEGEPAFKNFVANMQVNIGTYLWRVRNFTLEDVSGDPVPDFFRGDSYLALAVTGAVKSPVYTIFYWIGSETSLDEAGTAAYKAYELDTILTQRANNVIQYREVCDDETELFLSHFPGMRTLAGGYDSGFHRVAAIEHKKRLMRVYMDHIVEVPCMLSSLQSDGVFILDAGTTLYQWRGKGAVTRLVAPLMSAVRALDDIRGIESRVIVLSEGIFDPDMECFNREIGNVEQSRDLNTGDITITRDPTTGRMIGTNKPLRIITWDGDKFKEVKSNDALAITIVDSGSVCTIFTSRQMLPRASMCIEAYFTWAKKSPVNTRFQLI